MKKLLSLLLVCACCLSILAGCKKEEKKPAGTISDFESQAHFQPGTSGDDSESGDTSKAPVSGEFVVSEKKYDYNDANLELLYVENKTDKHYNVTIKGKYLDENGDIIKEETQTFEGFPSGWSNNFIFYPRTAFDSFTYAVETEEYVPEKMHADESGMPYASYLEFSYSKSLKWERGLEPINPLHPDDAKEVRDLLFYETSKSNHTTKTIGYEYHLLVLDSNGEVYLTDYEYRDYLSATLGVSGGWPGAVGPIGSAEGGSTIILKEQEAGEDETIPDNVQGVFTAIFSVISVYDYEAWQQSMIG